VVAEKNALTIALEARRAAKLPICDLTIANPTVVGLPYDREVLLSAIADPRALIYEPEPLGLSSARSCIAEMYGTTADRVLLTASTSEAYSMILKLLCAAGDEILVPAPSYPLFAPLAELAGVRTVAYPLAYDGAWHVDFSRWPKAERTRAIFCVSPNNPTGSIATQAELDRFADLGLPIVIDEVFDFYRFVDRPRATTDRVPTFRMGGLSKLACLPQMKLAWTIASTLEPMHELEHIADAFLSVGTPVQHACARLIEATTPTRSALLSRLRSNLAHLRAALAGTALTVLDVEGGWYACVRLPRTKTEEEWALGFLDRGLLVHPGHFFDFEEEAYVIVSLIAEPSEFARGVAILKT
jgi:aspartate/methionine/tyrosine aminotransferase